MFQSTLTQIVKHHEPWVDLKLCWDQRFFFSFFVWFLPFSANSNIRSCLNLLSTRPVGGVGVRHPQQKDLEHEIWGCAGNICNGGEGGEGGREGEEGRESFVRCWGQIGGVGGWGGNLAKKERKKLLPNTVEQEEGLGARKSFPWKRKRRDGLAIVQEHYLLLPVWRRLSVSSSSWSLVSYSVIQRNYETRFCL